MKNDEFQRLVLEDLAAIKKALGVSKGSITSRVVAPPGDTIPPTDPRMPPGVSGPIEPPPIDRTA